MLTSATDEQIRNTLATAERFLQALTSLAEKTAVIVDELLVEQRKDQAFRESQRRRG